MIIEEIVWDEFTCLEPPEPKWLEELEYWEEFVELFFQSNGIEYSSEKSNVREWLVSKERAPFVKMAEVLIDRLSDFENSQLDYVFLAHWLPDVHLGTSVTNFAMHKLGVNRAFGIAFSDSGLEAPFIALDCIKQSLNDERQGIVMVMDQKCLLYKSSLVDELQPKNTCSIIRLKKDKKQKPGLRIEGIYRRNLIASRMTAECESAAKHFGFEPSNTVLISSDQSLVGSSHSFRISLLADRRHVCAAPFVALAQLAEPFELCMLVTIADGRLTALGLRNDI